MLVMGKHSSDYFGGSWRLVKSVKREPPYRTKVRKVALMILFYFEMVFYFLDSSFKALPNKGKAKIFS